MPPILTFLSHILSFGQDHPMGLATLVGICLLSGIWAGRTWQASRAQHRTQALELAYSQALQDSYIVRRVVESTSDGLVVLSMDGKVIWTNPAYCQMLLRHSEDMIGRNPQDFAATQAQRLGPQDLEAFRFNSSDPTESGLHLWRNRRANGEEFWNQINLSFRTAPDGTEHAIMSCRDVTAQVERERELEAVRTKLEFTVAHDDLTGIANRAALMDFTRLALESAAETGRQIGMMRIDLDRFKEVNDTHGHPTGDAVLRHVAKVFLAKLRNTDMVARIGGDEFVVVCPDIGNLEDLEKIATTLGRASRRPFDFEGKHLHCSASFGVALSDRGSLSVETLLQHSDFALYETKRQGRGGVTAYSEGLHGRHMQHLQLRKDLKQALRDDQLCFHFQPTIDLRDGSVSGFETLVRWDHPTHGLLPPASFLPLAEELGLMADLDLAAMRGGIAMKNRLTTAGFPGLRLGMNASAQGLISPNYFPQLRELVERHAIDPFDIAVEVLETVMFDANADAHRHAAAIAQLHSHGFQTLLDDFGIGYAGLSHLAKLTLSGVKMDRSLASRVLNDTVSHRIVRTIVGLCNDLDLRLIAEGVEDQDVAACLRDMGVVIMQGYWISKPMPEADVVPWLQNYKPLPLPVGPKQNIDTDSNWLRPGQQPLAG